MSEIEKYAQENVDILLVGNKSDLESEREVTKVEGQELARQFNAPFIETSAQNASNVQLTFKTMATNIMERTEREPVTFKRNQGVKLGTSKTINISKKKSGPCC